MIKQYSACIIGTGRIGFTLGFDKKREQPASHTMALLNNSNVRIIAGCDKDQKLLAQWQYPSKMVAYINLLINQKKFKCLIQLMNFLRIVFQISL